MTSIKVKFRPSSTIQKEGTLHYQIIHHREVRKLRTGYRLFPSEWNTVLKRINVSAGKNEERRLYLRALKIFHKNLLRSSKLSTFVAKELFKIMQENASGRWIFAT
jgi:hypothetical protein